MGKVADIHDLGAQIQQYGPKPSPPANSPSI
jgi:hypothetical protein